MFKHSTYVSMYFIFSPGNYSCSCNIGYELYTKNGTAGFLVDESESGERDGDVYQRNKTCVPVMCSKLKSPENGKILSTKVKIISMILCLRKTNEFPTIMSRSIERSYLVDMKLQPV